MKYHYSDCSIHNSGHPALLGSCDCGYELKVQRRYAAYFYCLFCNQVVRYKTRLRSLMGTRHPDTRTCTCHPDDSPPQPCAKRYALADCKVKKHIYTLWLSPKVTVRVASDDSFAPAVRAQEALVAHLRALKLDDLAVTAASCDRVWPHGRDDGPLCLDEKAA